MHPCKVYFVLSHRPSLGLLPFVQTCCDTVASSNFPPPSSPELNTLIHPITADIPPPRYLATSWSHFPTFSSLFLAGPPGWIHSGDPSNPSEK
ncbi:hypothetical protein PBY51_014758 [Eleginops maclovinus]|uniref:Uncharacterized protein n=1 Tax=Eleginops maclovinus TaxID=56733 RepID=A0AAN8AB84_ELEMC|nr:hypothetical protein PBY51_014758 [Eleginops maclovinus]